MNKLEKVIANQIDNLPRHKLAYLIHSKDLVKGLKLTIVRYGFPYTKEVHETLVDMVGVRLTDNPDIECEWSEEEYENFVKYEGVSNETQN